MADCEKNIFDVPVSPTNPGPSDYLMWTLPDGTSVLRDRAHSLSVTPDDIEYTVADVGADMNNGDTTKTILEHVNQRVRLFRNFTPASRDPSKEQYYLFDNTTGTYTFIPAASTGET